MRKVVNGNRNGRSTGKTPSSFWNPNSRPTGSPAIPRVAMISDNASPLADLGSIDSGGQNIYVAQVSRMLAHMGYQVDVFTRKDSESLPPMVSFGKGLRVVHVPAGPQKFIPKEDLLPTMEEFSSFVAAFFKKQTIPYSIVHAHFFMSGLVAVELKRLFGTPFVVTFHALGRVRRLHQGSMDTFPSVRFHIEDRIVAEANRIVAECPQDLQDLTDLYSADPGRVVMIPCGFSPSELWPIDKAKARDALGLPEDEKIILQLSRIVPRKGVDNAIRGFARLVKHYGIESRLLIVGGESQGLNPSTSPEIRRLMDIAKKEGVFEKVSFLGKRGRDEVRLYYNASDVFVSTPWYEPFGITPVEAMACGTPVVGSNVGGIKFSVVDGETGFLVSPNDPEALAKKLAFLCTHPQERARMGILAIKRANRLFTWQRVVERIAATYEETLGELQEPMSEKTGLVKGVADSRISGFPIKEALEAE